MKGIAVWLQGMEGNNTMYSTKGTEALGCGSGRDRKQICCCCSLFLSRVKGHLIHPLRPSIPTVPCCSTTCPLALRTFPRVCSNSCNFFLR